jgi:hypothetical protein
LCSSEIIVYLLTWYNISEDLNFQTLNLLRNVNSK